LCTLSCMSGQGPGGGALGGEPLSSTRLLGARRRRLYELVASL
jgi:hypothetical protein